VLGLLADKVQHHLRRRWIQIVQRRGQCEPTPSSFQANIIKLSGMNPPTQKTIRAMSKTKNSAHRDREPQERIAARLREMKAGARGTLVGV
jgi:hypothetical protein